ncbi:MAG: hypothetical protein ACYTKD_14460, partial [Planctomycetota bacterium]
MSREVPSWATPCLLSLAVCMGTGSAAESEGRKERRFRARDVFDYRNAVIFQDDFRSGRFGKWRFSEDDRYNLPEVDPARMRIVAAPGLGRGSRAVRFAVQRAPNSFRSEISLPHEKGFRERWYGESIFVPDDWVFDSSRGSD